MKYINGNHSRPYYTPEMKDKLLQFLIDNLNINRVYSLNKQPIQEFMDNMDWDLIDGLFWIFQNDGLIDKYALNFSTIDLILLPVSVDFIAKGGYRMQAEIIEKQLELLRQQLKDLQKTKSWDKINTILETITHLKSLIQVAFIN